MKTILCVRFPMWEIDRLRREFGKRRSRSVASSLPLVIVRTIATRQEIVAVSDEASRFSIRPGMTLAQARSLCAHVQHHEHEPHRDAVALEALARWMMRFTPIVSIAKDDTHSSFILHPSSLFLDLTGCDRAFNGFDNLIGQIQNSLDRFGFQVKLAIAPTPGAAWALTFKESEPRRHVFDPEAQTRREDTKMCHSKEASSCLRIFVVNEIDPLPPATLRIDPDCAAALHHLGIETIGQLRQLPRDQLPSRFGPQLLLRLDQALGKIPEPLVPLIPIIPIETRADFDFAVESLESIWLILEHLLMRIVNQLSRRGSGARILEMEFFSNHAPPMKQKIELSRPTRDTKQLYKLMQCSLEKLQTRHGFTGFRLCIPLFQRIQDEQINLLDQEQYQAEIELDRLVERLRIRMGQNGIAQLKLIESHLPENSWSEIEPQSHEDTKRSSCLRDFVVNLTRPLQLFTEPHEIRVMVSPSHDLDGTPIVFTDPEGIVRPIAHCTGPERIAGLWWLGHDKTRDYFNVEDKNDHRRFWIFRVLESRRWFVHGEFA